jgi:hypothetical protein
MRWLDVARTLRGWEPTWREMAEAFDRVGVEVVTRETRLDATRVWRTVYVKDGSRCWGREETPDLGPYEWRRVPPLHWVRWGGGEWAAGPVGGAGWAGGATPLDRQLAAWRVLPDAVTTGARGTIELTFVREGDAGRMAWEVDEATGQVVTLWQMDARRHLEWEERRTFAQVGGHTVLVGRTRRVLSLPGGEDEETLAWRTEGLEPVAGPP